MLLLFIYLFVWCKCRFDFLSIFTISIFQKLCFFRPRCFRFCPRRQTVACLGKRGSQDEGNRSGLGIFQELIKKRMKCSWAQKVKEKLTKAAIAAEVTWDEVVGTVSASRSANHSFPSARQNLGFVMVLVRVLLVQAIVLFCVCQFRSKKVAILCESCIWQSAVFMKRFPTSCSCTVRYQHGDLKNHFSHQHLPQFEALRIGFRPMCCVNAEHNLRAVCANRAYSYDSLLGNNETMREAVVAGCQQERRTVARGSKC